MCFETQLNTIHLNVDIKEKRIMCPAMRMRLDTLLRVAAEHSFHHSIEGDMLCEDSPALPISARAPQQRNQATEQVQHCHRIPPVGLSASACRLSAKPRSLSGRPRHPFQRQCCELIARVGNFAVGCWGHSGHPSRGLRTPVLCTSGDPIGTKPEPFSLAAGQRDRVLTGHELVEKLDPTRTKR